MAFRARVHAAERVTREIKAMCAKFPVYI